MFGNQFSGPSGFFLSPIPRDRHQDFDRLQQERSRERPPPRDRLQEPERIPQERSVERPPTRSPCPHKLAPPEQPESHDKLPAPRSKTYGPRKRESEIGGSCTAQLKLVDQDLLTGRTYIHALDKRFRILSRNLKKAMKDCEQVNVTTTSNAIEMPQQIAPSKPECSELAVQLPKYAHLQEIAESNDWGSAIESMQQMMPSVIDATKENSQPGEELAPDLRSTCESFRNYRRGQRFGRYGYGYAYDSDFDSDGGYGYGYGYGRRYPRYYRRRGYMTDYGDPDFDYYRSPYGRRGYPYGRYYGGRGYGRMSYRPPRSSLRGSDKGKSIEEPKKPPQRFDSFEDHMHPEQGRKKHPYDGRRRPGRGRKRYRYELYDDYSSEGFSTDSDLFSDSEMEDYRSDKRRRFGRRRDFGGRRGDSGGRRRDSGDRRRNSGDRRRGSRDRSQSNERYDNHAASRIFGHCLHLIKTKKKSKRSSKHASERAKKPESVASRSSLTFADSDATRRRSRVVCHRYDPYGYGGGYYGGYGRRYGGYGGRYGRRRYGGRRWGYGGRYGRSGRYRGDMLGYYSSDYGYDSGLSGYGYGYGYGSRAYDAYPYMPYYDSQSFFSSDDDLYGGYYGGGYGGYGRGYGRGYPYGRRHYMSSIMGQDEGQKAIEETNEAKVTDQTSKSKIKEEVTTNTTSRKCRSESHHSDPQTYSKEPGFSGCLCKRRNRRRLKHHCRKADGISANSA